MTTDRQRRGRRNPNAATPSTEAEDASWGVRGYRAARDTQAAAAEASRARAAAGFSPWRFGLKKEEEAEIIILDETLDSLFYLFEHQVDRISNGKWAGADFEPCPQEQENCPLCEQADAEMGKGTTKRAHFAMMLSVIDTRELPREGKEPLPFTKNLLCVKGGQMEAMGRILEAAQNANGGSLRGVALYMARGTGEMSARIGDPTPYDDGRMFEILEPGWEEEFMLPEPETGREGQVLKEVDHYVTPYIWGEVFKKPSRQDLLSRYGSSGGGQRHINQDEEGEAPATAPPRSRRRGMRSEPETQEEAPPRTRGTRSRGARQDTQEENLDPPTAGPSGRSTRRGRGSF